MQFSIVHKCARRAGSHTGADKLCGIGSVQRLVYLPTPAFQAVWEAFSYTGTGTTLVRTCLDSDAFCCGSTVSFSLTHTCKTQSAFDAPNKKKNNHRDTDKVIYRNVTANVLLVFPETTPGPQLSLQWWQTANCYQAWEEVLSLSLEAGLNTASVQLNNPPHKYITVIFMLHNVFLENLMRTS